MKRICVFCGSSPGSRPEYIEAAEHLARSLAGMNVGLVYGGASVGIMGRLARAVLREGGRVTGVIPRGLMEKEVAFTDLPDLRVVDSMHERKALMVELSDGFIAMPGGLGTIEEFFEVLTWGQLFMHKKPCGLLNVCQYYSPLIDFLDHAVEERFIQPEYRSMILLDEDPGELLRKFRSYRAPEVDKAGWALRMNDR